MTFKFQLLLAFLISQATGFFIHARTPPQNTISPAIVCISHYKLLPSDFKCGDEIKCSTVVQKFPDLGLGQEGLSNFFALNPQVNNPACDNLHIGQVYCVATLDLGNGSVTASVG